MFNSQHQEGIKQSRKREREKGREGVGKKPKDLREERTIINLKE
jgi:hypothetical protein